MILELKIVMVFALFITFTLLIQSVLTTRQIGLQPLVGNRDEVTLKGIAGRSDRAVKNSLIALIFVLPPVLALAIIEQSTNGTVLTLLIFLCARILYFIAYMLSIAWVRSGLWWAGMFCIFYLYSVALTSA